MAIVETGQMFLDMLERAQLLRADVLEKIRPQLTKHLEGDSKRLAMTLIKNQLITEYQARAILSGKYKGFYLGKYKFLELIGAGGMGKVFLAEQVTMERLVAVKVMAVKTRDKDQQKQVIARFKREAKAVAALRHENIVHAYDFAEENGIPYIVMEYVEGLDTARVVHKSGPMEWPQASDVISQAAAGLACAHAAGLVHRDVKPGNLLVDTHGVVKILDLGLVSALEQKKDDSLTIDQDQLGTVDFMAPEQAVDSHNVDKRADVYSLGATFYSILTGRVLYPDKSTAQKLLLCQTTNPEPIDRLIPGIPAELAACITKMLSRDPANRYQDMAEVLAALKPFAKRKTPPYELNSIKYPRSVFERFVGKSPDSGDITVATMGDVSPENSAIATATSDSKSGRSSKPSSGSKPRIASKSMINPASVINQKSNAAEYNAPVPDDAYTRLAMPSVVGRKKKVKAKKSKPFWEQSWFTGAAIGGGLLAVALVAVTVFWSPASSNESLSSTLPRGTAAPGVSTPTLNNSGPTASVFQSQSKTSFQMRFSKQSRFQPLDIRPVATALSTQPMFNATGGDIETFRLPHWKSRVFFETPFVLVDPLGDTVKNVIVLRGLEKTASYPQQVSLAVNSPVKTIHMLSGASGWGFPVTQEQTTTLTVRLTYQDGKTEDHELKNGIHFADYIKQINVPGSEFAFSGLGQQQMRYLKIQPDHRAVITKLDFIKSTANLTAPIIMAVTVEEP